MDGLAFVQMIERELKERKIPKQQFYSESGISSATFSQWRKRVYSPSSAAIRRIEEYLGITFSLAQDNAEHSAEKEKTPTVSGEGELSENLVQLLTQMTPEQRARVEEFAKFVKAEAAAASAHK